MSPPATLIELKTALQEEWRLQLGGDFNMSLGGRTGTILRPSSVPFVKARNYCAHHNTRDHWTLRRMNRCPDLVVCLKRDLQCLRPETSLVLIYRPNVAGMKGRVDLAQPVNRTPDLWCGSPIHYHSILFGEK
ncbi:hypothetical protein TNCV_4413501 [Trichonephila clavipes]|nr:hypothetical protein TNCV_4413501 [Trichonephila clavipes]